MPSSTPFIDALTDSQRAYVQRRARGERRPSYFSGTLARTNAALRQFGQSNKNVDEQSDQVQISEDLEALLILLPIDAKKRLIEFIQLALAVSLTADEIELMLEVVTVRTDSYTQTNTDVGAHLSRYDDTREAIIRFIAQVAAQASIDQPDDPVSIAVPDINNLFAVLREDHANLWRPDLLSTHDRITDAATMYSYLESGTYRRSELLSWVVVVTAYLS